MHIFYIIYFFILGTVFGSFYNVVGYRLPKGESVVKPGSHCPNCGYELKPLDLVPVFSYLFLGGKCRKCKTPISGFYAFFELITGILFSLAYVKFGISIDLAIALVFISCMVIESISDFHYMIIIDEVLVITDIILLILLYIKGLDVLTSSLVSGFAAMIFLLSIKLIADKAFKKESMGYGDIKLMFTIGLVVPLPESLLPLFIAAFLALPYALYSQSKSKDPEFPFGPFLALAALIIYFTDFDIINFLIK